MGKTIFRERDRQELHDRFARLTPSSQRRWGKMNAAQMICHLQDSLAVATGAVPAKRKRTRLAHPVLRFLAIYVLPWPKGKVRTAPEMLVTQPADWDADVNRLRDALDSAAALGPTGRWAPHPAFGDLPGRHYGRLIYRHCSYHLSQFGV